MTGTGESLGELWSSHDDFETRWSGTDLEATLALRNLNMGNSKLYVGNMSFKTSEDELRSAFGQYGTVSDVYIAMDKMTNRPRGFAFVTMNTPEEAKLAAEKMNGTDLGGRALTVNEARPKEEGAGGGRSFGGGERRGGFGGGERRGGFGGGRGGDRRY
jgi:cold-inducible RNA-binding protein